ncbi:DUF6443 domain-containing protein [Chitinophaga tropicalis]|uniref:DUF6443 domain-containing protein n=1 Tax=Chitinophaga tropicalis TaxID=2683588 RepID=A0A7K1U035_9BACT|nr:DUF6443 domain-containing protein [Chitinophaga tropicalis]MVT07722.1 hypothetical protein [Chitinophaga tropicalis]
MKNILRSLTALVLLLVVQVVEAQIIPEDYTNSPITGQVPGAYSRTTINYVRVWQPAMPSTDTAVIKSSSRTVGEVRQQTTYYDGLGRDLQVVQKGFSPTGKDIVKPFWYDPFGREGFEYLSFTPLTGNTSDGKFKSDPFIRQQAYYANTTANPGVNGESIPYGEIEFEASPLSRIEKRYLPGTPYAKLGGNRPMEKQYLTNAVSDSVHVWTMAALGVIPTSSSTALYAANTLYKNVDVSPDDEMTVSYLDKDGRLILMKRQVTASPGSGHIGWACTYYVYDDFDNLRFVISPQAVDAIKSNWVITTSIAAELCYIYRYDERGRMIVSKQPGTDSTEQIYDKRDRLICKRNGISKGFGQWQVYYYDELDREVMSGIIYTPYSRVQLRDYIESLPYSPTVSIPDIDTATEVVKMTNSYYDTYTYNGVIAFSSVDVNKVMAYSNSYAEANAATAGTMTRGLLTGRRVNIVGNSQYLISSFYYNDKGRQVQTAAENTMGGRTVTNTLYDFQGKTLSTYVRHTNPLSTTTPQTTLLTMNHYDVVGRLDSTKYRLNDNLSTQTDLALLSYDESGRVKQKRLAPTGSASQLESLVYEYDLRGNLNAINKAYVTTTGSTSNFFGQQIMREYGFTNKCYDGNIAGIKWKTASDGNARAYGYNYDKLDRVIAADYTQQNQGSTAWTRNLMDFTVSNLSYDLNGNLLSMKQVGMDGMAIKTIDSLKYGYIANSNRLNYVTDKRNNPSTALGDFKEILNTETQDYWYDPSGNLSKDKNKDIDTIVYDYNNRPAQFFVKNRGKVFFNHDALGVKVAKIVADTSGGSGTNTVTHYDGPFVYVNDSLQYILTEEGRIRTIFKSGVPVTYVHDWFEKDYQGNVRVVLGSSKDTAQYAATMENARTAVENATYSNIDLTRTAKPASYPTDNTTNPNDFVAKLNGSTGQKIGPAIVLKVMRGDTIAATVKAFYTSTTANTSSNTVSAMLSALLSSFSSGGIVQNGHYSNGPSSPLYSLTNSEYQQLRDKDPNQNQATQPKAYLSYAAFDDQFNLVDGNSGVLQVPGSPNTLLSLVLGKMVVQKSGFIYLYLNNESAADVYFDNFMVTHLSGPLLEENHYYPYGLTMAGLSSHALKGALYDPSEYKFNGKELQRREFKDGASLEWYDFGARMQDPQIGRWHTVDPLADSMRRHSPYSYAFGNPIRFIDYEGLFPQDPQDPGPGDPGYKFKGVKGLFELMVYWAFSPANTFAYAEQAGNTKDLALKAEYTAKANAGAVELVGGVAFGYVLGKITGTSLARFARNTNENPFTLQLSNLKASAPKGKLGEELTKAVLEKKFKGAVILEQVYVKLDNGVNLRIDFLLAKKDKFLAAIESKVDGAKLSGGQSDFFVEGIKGVLSGKNAGAFEGFIIDPSKLKTGIYRWNSKTGTFVME